MELAFVVYLISILGSVSSFLKIISSITICAALMLLMFSLIILEGRLKHKKTFIALVIIALFSGGAKALLPSEKQAYIILGAYTAQTIAENKNVQEVGGKLLTLVNQKLDEAIKKDEK